MSYKSTNNLQKNWKIGFDLPPKIRFLAMYSAVEPVAHALFTCQLNTTTSFYLRKNSSITMFCLLSIAIFKSYHHQNKNSKIIQRLLLTRICSRTVFLIFFKKFQSSTYFIILLVLNQYVQQLMTCFILRKGNWFLNFVQVNNRNIVVGFEVTYIVDGYATHPQLIEGSLSTRCVTCRL